MLSTPQWPRTPLAVRSMSSGAEEMKVRVRDVRLQHLADHARRARAVSTVSTVSMPEASGTINA
jgi:hypothetical protein